MKAVLIVFFLLFCQSGQALTGAWSSGELKDKAGLYAGASNDSGGLLTQYCYYHNQDCYWSMSNGTTKCNEFESYPALVSSDAGAVSMAMYCYKSSDGASRMTFSNFKLIDDAIQKSKRLAVVVPLQGGDFRVTRFDLTGAVEAVTAMRRTLLERTKRSTKDQTL